VRNLKVSLVIAAYMPVIESLKLNCKRKRLATDYHILQL